MMTFSQGCPKCHTPIPDRPTDLIALDWSGLNWTLWFKFRSNSRPPLMFRLVYTKSCAMAESFIYSWTKFISVGFNQEGQQPWTFIIHIIVPTILVYNICSLQSSGHTKWITIYPSIQFFTLSTDLPLTKIATHKPPNSGEELLIKHSTQCHTQIGRMDGWTGQSSTNLGIAIQV